VSKEGSSRSCKRRCWRASSEKEHLAILKKSSRRRNRRSGFAEETIAKSRQPLDLRKVAQGLEDQSR
jgi:hypothetical protein